MSFKSKVLSVLTGMEFVLFTPTSLLSRPPMVGGIGNVWKENWSEGLGPSEVRGQTPVRVKGRSPSKAEHFLTNYKKF